MIELAGNDVSEITDAQPVRFNAPTLRRSRAVAKAAPPPGPMGSALAFLQAGGTIDQVRDMLALQREWESNEARKAFAIDMAEFKKNPPQILKDKRVSFDTTRGLTEYDHATIGNVCDKIITAAAAYGLTHRWVPARIDGAYAVTCVVTHRLGHFEETTLQAKADDSGGKNSIQAIISTNTYLSRHSLLMAFGFATMDQPDDDGRASGERQGEGGVASDAVQAWSDKAKAAPSLHVLNDTRKLGAHEFNAAKDVAGWNAFKAVVEIRRAALTVVAP